MNARQRLVVKVGAGVCLAMLVVPPWLVARDGETWIEYVLVFCRPDGLRGLELARLVLQELFAIGLTALLAFHFQDD